MWQDVIAFSGFWLLNLELSFTLLFYPLKNLILLGCRFKQNPVVVFSINKIFPLAEMSIIQNFSGKNMGQTLNVFCSF